MVKFNPNDFPLKRTGRCQSPHHEGNNEKIQVELTMAYDFNARFFQRNSFIADTESYWCRSCIDSNV